MERAKKLKPEETEKPHLVRLFITQQFIKNLIEDAQTYKKGEDEEISNQNKNNILYPAIVQDVSELLMNLAIPISKTHEFRNVNDLLFPGDD